MKSSAPKTLRLRLRPTAESIVRSGHPWVFGDSIKEQNREGAAGELAVIFDRNDKFLAVGFYDPDSPIRVRILHTGKPIQIDANFWKSRFDAAMAKRAGMFDERTTGYRCIHGENDGFPGLVLDRYDDTFVLKIYTAAWRDRTREILPFLVGIDAKRVISTSAAPHCEEHQHLIPSIPKIVLRSSRNLNLGEPRVLQGVIDGAVQFLESGLRFEADVLRGQKTGFFLDQRENRKIVETLARDRDVLNTFSFSGGFSVYAARGGARTVTDVDISAHALVNARRNFALNNLEQGRHETIQADTFEFLASKPTGRFGLIVLDPPSLAKRESEKSGALGAYRKLVEFALAWLAPKGILVAASCSAHVTPEEFFTTVLKASKLKEFRRTENPPDHPAAYPEARYLKCIYLR
jgi:23S rRNA (cytosine1962-C5)-methyltransferase